MAVQPKFSYVEETFERVIPPSKDFQSRRRSRREYTFTSAQIVVAWCVIAGMMVAVFLFGLFAGREQGVRQALNDRGQVDKKVEIIDQVTEVSAPKNDLAKVAEVNNSQAKATSKQAEKVELKSVEKTETQVAKVAAKPEVKNEKASIPGVEYKISSGYYLQLAARKRPEDVQKLAASVDDSSFPMLIEKAKVGGADYYRLLSGPYKTLDEANKAQKTAKKWSDSLGKPFIKRVE